MTVADKLGLAVEDESKGIITKDTAEFTENSIESLALECLDEYFPSMWP